MIRKLLACFGCLFIIIVLVAVLALFQGYRFWLATPSKEAESVAFTVAPGEGLSSIAEDLADRGLISNAFWFKVYAKMTGIGRNLQAGDFFLTPGMNYAALTFALTKAETNEVQITIPEGYTVSQIGDLVTDRFAISDEDWLRVTGAESPIESYAFIVEANKPDDIGLEGYLFPDTYRFLPDATAEEIVLRMVQEMEEHVNEAAFLPSTRAGGPTTVHEFITLASIIEREVRAEDEMRTVSGIFYNRLEIDMALQADSTVNYITGGDSPSVSLDDTDIDSPYNTYRYAGLPPGPISNPGRRALDAAAHPNETSYFFFLTSPEGEVYYADTFDQHIVNRNLYLR